MTAMKSVCPGCAHEEACGHSDVTHCANRLPANWCSCDVLRRAQAERDRYRGMALSLACQAAQDGGCRGRGACGLPDGEYCDAVVGEVDG